MLIRHGVRLSPKQADIFDLIELSGNRGVCLDTLAWVFFGDRTKQQGKNAAKVHICNINAMFAASDVRVIVSDRKKKAAHGFASFYRVLTP